MVKLQIKLALYNAISKALIILGIGLLLPVVVERVVNNNIDQRLKARADKMMLMVHRGGINEIIVDADCSFGSYSIFKEEFVSIKPLIYIPKVLGEIGISNDERNIEGEIVKHRVLSKTFLYDNQLYEMEIGEGLSAIDDLNKIFRQFTFGVLAFVILISIFLDLGFARFLLRPFHKIVDQKLQGVYHPSTFKEEKIKTNTYEFAYLDQSINEMMHKIKEAFQMEREFITNVSHELLTPISILQNRVENILADPNINDDIAMKMVDSQKTLLRLSKVIKALLYISKIENEQYLKNETVSVKHLINEVLEEIEERTESKSITVHQQWINDFDFGNCNVSLLHTLLFNLISNAIKYNKSNGEIFIAGRKEETVFVLTIKDTGLGIEEKQLPHIFGRFKRFRPDEELSYGLGLPIVKTIADFHNIKINVSSKINSGTSFTLCFPLKHSENA